MESRTRSYHLFFELGKKIWNTPGFFPDATRSQLFFFFFNFWTLPSPKQWVTSLSGVGRRATLTVYFILHTRNVDVRTRLLGRVYLLITLLYLYDENRVTTCWTFKPIILWQNPNRRAVLWHLYVRTFFLCSSCCCCWAQYIWDGNFVRIKQKQKSDIRPPAIHTHKFENEELVLRAKNQRLEFQSQKKTRKRTKENTWKTTRNLPFRRYCTIRYSVLLRPPPTEIYARVSRTQ